MIFVNYIYVILLYRYMYILDLAAICCNELFQKTLFRRININE